MPCARCAVQSSTGKYSAQDLRYKVVLWGTVWTACSIYKVVLRGVLDVSSKSVQEECLTRVFQSIERECFTRVCHKSVRQECLTRVSHKSVPQECPTRVCHESVTKDCPTRLSEKSVKEECSARVAFNAIQHLLFAFHCSVGTLLLRELWKNAFGFVASIRFFYHWAKRRCTCFHQLYVFLAQPGTNASMSILESFVLIYLLVFGCGCCGVLTCCIIQNVGACEF